MSAGPDGPRSQPRMALILAGMTGQTAFFVLLGLSLWWFSGRALGDFLTFSASEVAIGIALAAAFTLVGVAVFFGLPRVSEYLVREQARTMGFLKIRFGPAMLVFIAMCAGIGEEALFRAGIQTLLSDYLPIAWAIILASAVFGLLHFSQPLIGVLQALIGAVFGIVYWQTGSLLTVMIGHGLYDIFALWYVQRELHRLGVFDEAPLPFASDLGENA